MKPRSLLLAALAALLFLPAISAAHAQDKFHLKDGARGKICLQCHVAFEEGLKKPFVHTPVKEGSCVDCHSPHTSSHGKLLAAESDAICGNCHEGMAPKTAVSVHPPVAGGHCIECHDPHASENRNNLVRAGNELCAGCHKDIVQRAAQAKFAHSPVAKSCLTCHDAHASETSGSLLRKPVPDLCTSCHKTDQASFKSQHMGYPVGTAKCTSCHDPHGSDNRGILWANVHQPLLNKMCSQCHVDASSPDPLKTRKAGFEICRGCHSDVLNEISTSSRVHWPAVNAVACLNCHSPHASKQEHLLVKPVKPLCGTCHQAMMESLEKAAVKHPPAEDGECATCHSPHASNTVFLLNESGIIEQCGSCHDWKNHTTHPLGEKAIDPRNKNLTVDCMSCHQPHGSPFKAFTLKNPDSDLCVQCHAGEGR
ncbi:MAG TPA: cytochrome c3 family protein [Candidatus Saccharimonadales bacterium]|nr:cytochrome c3 family protein [Candidatus Saccharimonadales bacterium]